MTNREEILNRIYKAVDEVNLQLPAGRRLVKAESTVLLDEAGSLDSLAFLNLIVATEDHVSSLQGVPTALASRLMESEKDHLPRTIAELADTIRRILDEHSHE